MSIRNIIYYHQSLPLYRFRFNPFKSGGKSLFFYSYIYPLYVRLLMNSQTYVAVQTETVKDKFSKRYHFPLDRIGVYFPKVDRIDADNVGKYDFESDTFNFIYPSIGAVYKGHLTIVYALERICTENQDIARRIQIHFTIPENDNLDLYKYICQHGLKDNFVFHGSLPHEQVLSMMKASHGLLFPSMIETLGLPLFEAASLGVPVIANDLGYAREVLHGYQGVSFVKAHDYDAWADMIKAHCRDGLRFSPHVAPYDGSWERLIRQMTDSSANKRPVVCVLATASAKRGALAIYNQLIQALAATDDAVKAEWHVFLDVDMPMPEMPHVYYHVYHTKGFGRVWFDLAGFKRAVKRLGIIPDTLFSLQNTGARC